MKLIPEQIRGLRKEVRNRYDGEEEFRAYLSDRKIVAGDETFCSCIGDTFTETSYQLNQNRMNEKAKLLDNSEYVFDRVVDHIDIGTRFSISFSDMSLEKPEVHTLVETLEGVSISDGFISTSSPIGKAIYGLHEGDEVEYSIPRGKIKVKIEEIDKDLSSYLRPIRAVPASNRRCLTEKTILNNLLKNDIVEYNKRFAISYSQAALLLQELSTLEKQSKSAENYNIIRARKRKIKGILSKKNFAHLPLDGTIGVGTRFSIKIISKDGEQVIEDVEMINRAFSTEFPGEYIERISLLGSKVFGLREGEEFTFRLPNGKNAAGYVYNIQNTNTMGKMPVYSK